ncbi:MAG: RecQ family zinc-binding domain-containing protein, partial [Bacteroidales bacterium]|nr:RecQ family zinc-binding domain-containing protein [Bacteroidales bacterium]
VYVVRKTEDKHREMLKIAGKVQGTGVVYVRNRRKTRELAGLLVKHGVRADYYHAGLKFAERMKKQEEWQQDKIRIMVSTNAFGMGIDKSDVRFVIHIDLPDSPEAYFQEAGRAGRDEEKAWAILLYSNADKRQAEKRIDVNFPGFDTLREIYKGLFNYLQVPVGGGKGLSMDFILGEFLSKHKFNAMTVTSALSILSREGYFEITDEINNPSRIHFTVGREELYKFQVRNPKFDAFIKLLLRSYTGLFSQYVAIDEYTLSRRSGLDQDDVYKYLLKLSGMKLINFIPKKNNPVITLLEERLEERNIRISAERYKFRKERYIERVTQMLAYAGTDTKCRSQFLLSYFGEKGAGRCGQCDVCLGQKDKGVSQQVFDEIADAVLNILEDSPAGLTAIIGLIDREEEDVTSVVDMLLEEGRIRRGEDLLFAICK